MNQHDINTAAPVDLTNCDREPIHIPGSIQPHGCLIACDARAVTALRHSANTGAMLGVAGEINGLPLETLIGAEATHTLRNALATLGEGVRPALLSGLNVRVASSMSRSTSSTRPSSSSSNRRHLASPCSLPVV